MCPSEAFKLRFWEISPEGLEVLRELLYQLIPLAQSIQFLRDTAQPK
jgi:hypothetical protein